MISMSFISNIFVNNLSDSRGVMDSASDFGSEGWGFKSLRGWKIFFYSLTRFFLNEWEKNKNDISDFLDKRIEWNNHYFNIADITHGIKISLELKTDEKLKHVVTYLQ